MRRLLAFMVDVPLAFGVSNGCLQVLSHLTNRDLINEQSVLLSAALLFTLTEYFYGGVTPGKFLCRIKVITTQARTPTIFALFVRAAILFLLPGFAALGLTTILELYVRRSMGYPTHEFLFLWALSICSLVLLIISRGSQALHDCLSRTVVVSAAKPGSRVLLSERTVAIVASLALGGVVGAAVLLKTDTGPLKEFQSSAVNREVVAPLMQVRLSTSELDAGISNLFELYEDFHGPSGRIPLATLFEPSDFQRNPLLSKVGPNQSAHLYKLHITLEGLLRPHFQEAIAKNICGGIQRRLNVSVCVIEFEYYGAFLDALYVSVYRRVVVVDMRRAEEAFPVMVTTSPPIHGTEVHVSNHIPQPLRLRREMNGR